MIDKDLKIGFHAGKNTLEQNATFFREMTESEMNDFAFETKKALWYEGHKYNHAANEAEDNIIISWIWVKNGFDLEKSPLHRCG